MECYTKHLTIRNTNLNSTETEPMASRLFHNSPSNVELLNKNRLMTNMMNVRQKSISQSPTRLRKQETNGRIESLVAATSPSLIGWEPSWKPSVQWTRVRVRCSDRSVICDRYIPVFTLLIQSEMIIPQMVHDKKSVDFKVQRAVV